jgi:O-antigen/teichoic acid export membrane protein
VSATDAPRAPRSVRVYGGLTFAQVFALATAVISSPLLARALGPEGRGLVASVQVPVGLAPYIAQLGVGAFAVNEAARGVSARLLLGSLGGPMLAVGLAGALLAAPVAALLVGTGSPVFGYLVVGLALLPLTLLVNLTLDVLWGEQRWRPIVLIRVLTPASTVAAIGVLYLADVLTVQTACVVVLANGLPALIGVLLELGRIGRPRSDRALRRRGLAFGLRAWGGTLASVANQRLDQLLMIPLLPARELGLYAVAVTIASVTMLFTSQVVTVLLPRVAAGEVGLVGPAVRSTLLIGLVTGVVVAVASLVALVPVFGQPFAQSRWLVLILVVAYIALAGAGALGQALAASGRPGAPSLAELVALGVTVPGLVLLLPTLEATGAALVSAAAYGTNLAVLVVMASRHFRVPLRDLLVPRAADVALARQLVKRR